MEANFRSPSSKVATFQFQSSTRSPFPQLQHTSRVTARGRTQSAFVKLSRISRQTFAKMRLESCTHNLTRKPQNSHKLVSAAWWLLLQRRIHVATLRPRIPRPTLVCGHSAHCRQMQMVHHSSFLLASHPYTILSRTKNNFRDPLRGTSAEVNAMTKRSSPS